MRIRLAQYITTLGLMSMLAAPRPVWGIASEERWDMKVDRVPQNAEMHDAGITTWTIPVGPTGIRAIITEANPTCFTVKYVFKNSPASGKIAPGDLICGANGKKIQTAHAIGKKRSGASGMEGPLTEMAPLIEAAQGGDGKLDLMYHPAGDTKVTKNAGIQIAQVGRFSPTYPYNCQRSEKTVTRLCEMLESELNRRDASDKFHVQIHMYLALMASGEKKYESLIRDFARSRADRKIDIFGSGLQSWWNGYEGIFLGEYYLKTKDRTVLPRTESLSGYYRDGIKPDGTYSHKSEPHIIDRFLNGGSLGYGGMSAPAGLSMLAMSLFRAGGVPFDEWPYNRIHRAYLKCTSPDKIGVGYGFGEGDEDSRGDVHIRVKDPKQGQSGRGPGFRCPTGMKDITQYEIFGVGPWCNTNPAVACWSQRFWKDDMSWVEKERDTNIVQDWGGNHRRVLRDNSIQEPTKPYNTTKGNSQAGTGLGALAHLIGNNDRPSWQYLGKHAANSAALEPKGWFQGHACAGLHQLWQALGAARADKDKFRAFMDYNKWWFIMMECHDGSYMVCPNRDRADGPGHPYTFPSSNAALILALARCQLQITGAEGPAGGYTPSSSPTSSAGTAPVEKAPAPVAATVRQARALTLERKEALDAALLKTLVALSDAGQLKEVPLNLSFTPSKVWLRAADRDGGLTFQIAGGQKTASMNWLKMPPSDRATLALLVAHLKPDSGDAKAMAGIYMETLGKVKEADNYYMQAGDASNNKLQALFKQ
jgi:hypothetical protein